MKKYLLAVLVVVSLVGVAVVGVGAASGSPLHVLENGMKNLQINLKGENKVDLTQPAVAVDSGVSSGSTASQAAVVDSQSADEADLLGLGPDWNFPWPPDAEWPDEPEERYVPISDEYCDGTREEPHPVAQKIADYFGVPYEEVIAWHCDSGYGFGEISLAYYISQDSGVSVEELFAMRESGMGWGEILIELGYAPGDFRPPLPKPEVPPHGNGNYCESGDVHPTAQRLADMFSVPAEEIMGWYCQGFSFNEIAHAYAISQEAGVPVDEVFALREQGMTWVQILQHYGLTEKPGKPEKPAKPEKPQKPEKPAKPPRPTWPGRGG